MKTGCYRDGVLEILRSACRGKLRDEEAAWSSIRAILGADCAMAPGNLEGYVHLLGLIYSRHTGAMPGYSKGENETRFERFVFAIPSPPGIRVTRNLVKSATRRLKQDPRFLEELTQMSAQN